MRGMFKSVISACALFAFAGALQAAEVVVIVNPKNAASLTKEQVSNLFLGASKELAPLDLPEASSERVNFYSKLAGKTPAQVKAIWTRMIFTGSGQLPKVMGSSADAVKYVAANEKAIAYVEKSAVDASVKTVMIVQ